MAQEQVFYSDDAGVRVSNSRFTVGATTYPLSGITSISAVRYPAKRSPAIWTAIIGLLLAAIGFNATAMLGVAGIVILAIGILWFFMLKDTFVVRTHTAGGETDAVSSTDEPYIHRIVAALNDAIVYRG
jgi:hypothetical protein